MRLLSKLAIVGATFATVAFSSTAAFAATSDGPNIPVPSCSPAGGNGPVKPSVTSDVNGGNCGNQGNHCDTTNSIFWHNSQQQGDTLYSDTQRNCGPVIPVSSDPCKWGETPLTSWIWENGRYVKCLQDESWNTCTHVTPKCQCKTQTITFETPTYGTWMKETYGPALFNGEIIKYDHRDWTVSKWTTPPNPKANGSQGKGDYFILTP